MGRCGLGDDVRLRHTRALGEGGQGARKGLLIWMQGARERYCICKDGWWSVVWCVFLAPL